MQKIPPLAAVCYAAVLWAMIGGLACQDSGPQAETSPEARSRSLTDMRGQTVKLPQQINRVVAIDDGFTASMMACLGELDKLVGLGSSCVQRNFSYEFSTGDGTPYAYTDGMNPVSLLHPKLRELPLVAAANMAINYEALAQLRPDLVVLRSGCCTLGCPEQEETAQAIRKLEMLGLPVFVLKGPPCHDSPGLGQLSEEIRLLGAVFGKAAQAQQIASLLETQADFVKARTAGLPEAEKPKVLLLGLSSRVREAGGAGNTKGSDTIESYFIEQLANAKNAYQGSGGRASYLILSAEQILALDPDAIVLPTASGYHPPRELYTAPYFRNLQLLRAVKNRRVYALPWTPCNCAKRLEYPIELLIIAKAAYPERFAGLKVHEWVLGFYQSLYGVDLPTAVNLRSAQWLDWTVEEDF